MTDLGFIGLGIMGKPMAGHLVGAGNTVFVFSRSPGPVKEMEAGGALACNSAREVAERSDIVFIMVPDTPDVETVLLEPIVWRRVLEEVPLWWI